MAESNIPAPIFEGAVGGLSDDIFTGIEQSFFSSKNIDIRSNAKGIKLNKALVKDSSTTITEKINKIIKLSNGNYMAFGNSGGLYRKATTTRTKITTDSPASAIVGACEFNGYIYWATSDYLHRILTSNISDNITATDVINRQALNSASHHPMIVSTGDMYIGNKNTIGWIDTSNTFLDKIILSNTDTVKFIDDLGGSIRIIATNTNQSNNIYLRDGVSDTSEQTIPMIGYDIKQSIIFNGYNYLITNKGLGILDGYKVYPIKKLSTFNGNLNSITVFDEKLYIGGTGGIYVYGTKNKNYPEVLNFENTTSNGNTADDIGAIYSDGVDLFVSRGNGSTYGIDKLSTTTYCTSGELETRGYYANSLYQIKETLNTMIGYKKLLANETISVYYSIDGGTYTKIVDIISTTDTLADFTIDMPIQGVYFQYIQFKFILAGNGTTSPELYYTLLMFNNNLKR